MQVKASTFALVLLMFATSAAAECAWVLWQEHRIYSDSPSPSWDIGEAEETKDACMRRAALQVTARADTMKSINANAPRPDPEQTIKIKGNSVEIWMAWTKQLWVYRYHCLPDTIDPRGPKGGGR
jgi:hypothetical protein